MQRHDPTPAVAHALTCTPFPEEPLFGGVSDATVLLGIVLIALAAMAVRLLRRRGTRASDAAREQEDAR